MSTLVINLGTPLECLISTCLIKKLKDRFENIDILVRDEECLGVFSKNNNISRTLNLKDDNNSYLDYENYVFLSVRDPSVVFSDKKIYGFGSSDFSDEALNILYGNKKTSKNVFEVYFNLIGEKWRGEGLTLEYSAKRYPVKNSVGFAIANPNLKKYIMNTLKLDLSKSFVIPFKDNLFKKIDETNAAETVVTDDFTYLNIALLLRKRVYFLKTINYNFNIELFRSGEILIVPKNIFIGMEL